MHHVTKLLDTLYQKHAAQFTTDEAAHLTAVRDHIALIRGEPPVIYAVNLAGLQRMTFSKTTLAMLTTSWLLRARREVGSRARTRFGEAPPPTSMTRGA